MNKQVKIKNIVVFMIIIILGIGVFYISYDKFLKPKSNDKNNDTASNQNNSNQNSNSNITKESIEEFLSIMVGDDVKDYNNIEDVIRYELDDSDTFIMIIRMLLLTNKYEQKETYIFKAEDVRNYAKKYFNLPNYSFDVSKNTNFVYDSNNDLYKSTLQFGVFEEGPYTYSKPKVNDIKINDFDITVNCSITTKASDSTVTNNYILKLEYEDEDYIIKSIAKDN